jgi:predicted PurR-regulated permease PerM
MSTPRLRLIFIGILAVMFFVMFIAWGNALVPFVIGLVIAYILDPFVVFLMRRLRMPRTLAVLLVFAIFLVVCGILVAFLYPMLVDGVVSISRTVTVNESNISSFLKDAESWLESLDLPFSIDTGKLISSIFAEAETFLKH